jgi:hypothetical protein
MGRAVIGVFIVAMLLFPPVATAQRIVVDHTSLALFDQIPDEYLQAARNLRMLFMDRSVGVNTNDALNCFSAASYGASATPCRNDYQLVSGAWQVTLRKDSDLSGGQVHPYIRFSPNPTRYNRSNWRFYLFYGDWTQMATDFITGLHNQSIPVREYPSNASLTLSPSDFDVLSFQFSYLNVDIGSTIGNFFTQRPGTYDDAYDLEREVGDHLTSSGKRFVYFTTSLARSIGTQESMNFNQQMRDWCRTNNKILFDFADIEAYDMYGRPCYDDRDGVPYTTPAGNASENYPDDGLNIPAICQEKAREVAGGHVSEAQGNIAVAKGLWVLMARLAGWNPDGAATPTAPQNLRVVPPGQ